MYAWAVALVHDGYRLVPFKPKLYLTDANTAAALLQSHRAASSMAHIGACPTAKFLAANPVSSAGPKNNGFATTIRRKLAMKTCGRHGVKQAEL